MIILVLNCGSSSIKYQLLDMQSESENTLLVKGAVERIGQPKSFISHTQSNQSKYVDKVPCANHKDGIHTILELFVSAEYGVISNLTKIDAIGHRLVHGVNFLKKAP